MDNDEKRIKSSSEQLEDLTSMINETLDTLKETVSASSNPRTTKRLSELVGDLFTAQKDAEKEVELGHVATPLDADRPEAKPPVFPKETTENSKLTDTKKISGQEKSGTVSGNDKNLTPGTLSAGAGGNHTLAGNVTAEEESGEIIDYSDEAVDERINAILEELNALTGLTTVKEEVHSLINIQKINVRRKKLGMKEADVSKHLVFSGNPGTGKTTVARILARVYHELGLLSKGQLIEVDRSGLVAGYIGQTAIKTSEVIQSAMGGILFVDEAYTLSAKRGESDFGQEAIDTILKAMEDKRDEFIVIVAGYTQLMEEFLDSNPGLRSRFNKFVFFPDYTPQELTKIFLSFAEKSGYKLSPEGEEFILGYYKAKTALAEPNFANARDARNLFEKAVTRQANRLADKADCTKEELELLTVEDLNIADKAADKAADEAIDKAADEAENKVENKAAGSTDDGEEGNADVLTSAPEECEDKKAPAAEDSEVNEAAVQDDLED